MTAEDIETFLHAQVRAWNAGDKDAFFGAYRKAAPAGLSIEYAGRGPATDGWPLLEVMWAQQSAKIEVEEVTLIVNGSEAACHNHNKLRGTSTFIDTIELYRFDEGRLSVCYFIRQPGAST
jgi:hypothetical protein